MEGTLKRRSTVGLASLLFAATLVGSPGTGAAEEEPPEVGVTAADSDAPTDRYVHFRGTLGFSTSPTALAEADVAANESSTLFGVPLTDAEFQELTTRQDVIERDAALIRSTLQSLLGSGGYAGLWMDNRGGGLLTVGVTTRADEVLQLLRQRVSYPERIAVRTLPRSLSTLEDLAQQVRTRAAELQIEVETAGVDERANGLKVLTPQDPTTVQQWLRSWLPADLPLLVETGTVILTGTKRMESPPLRGGQSITGGGFTCTSAFVARFSTTAYYLLSAGHCGPSGVAWNQAGFPVGTVTRSDTNGTDALRIPINANYRSNEVTLTNDALAPTQPPLRRSITSSQKAAADVVGQVSCITGQNFNNLRCGELLSRTFAVDIPEQDGQARVVYSDGREVDADCNPGDSGGPALYSGQARGIISVKVTRSLANDTCVYVHIEPALSQMGLTDVVTAPGLTTPV